jgi:hypothetical protein
MPVRESPPEPAPPHKQPYPAEKARGAEIILRRRRQRIVFLAGLVGAIVLGWFLISLWGSA